MRLQQQSDVGASELVCLPPAGVSPCTLPPTELWLSFPSLDTGIKCSLFYCFIAGYPMSIDATQLIGYGPPAEHFGLFFFKNNNNKPS